MNAIREPEEYEFVDANCVDIKEAFARLKERVRITIGIVTPEKAAEWKKHIDKQRKLSAPHVKRLARDMAAGRWIFTGQPIVFDSSGMLVNGMHTTHAVIESQTPIISLIVRGVDPNALYAFDNGKPRSFADLCTIYNKKHVSTVQAITRLVLKLERGNMAVATDVTYSNSELDECLSRNPDIEDAAAFVACDKRLRAVSLSSVAGFVRWHTYRRERVLSDRFFEAMASGVGLEKGDPVLLLREGLINARATGAKRKGLDPHYILAITIKAWNAFVRGHKVKTLRWRGDGPAAESFPEFK